MRPLRSNDWQPQNECAKQMRHSIALGRNASRKEVLSLARELSLGFPIRRDLPSMNSAALRVLLFALSAVATGLGAAVESAPRPNILFIFADDQPDRLISCYENAYPFARTPNIDRLAREGVRFRECHTGSWCQPSRASFLTGRLQHAVQSIAITTYPEASYDPQVDRFFPKVFRTHGYWTGMIGKWHLGPDVGHGREWDWSVIWDRVGKENSFAYYENQLVRVQGRPNAPLGGYSTDRYTELAETFLREAPRDKPWFLWLCYGAVHGPTTPAARHKGRYQNERVPVPADIFGPRPDAPTHFREIADWRPGADGVPVLKKGRPLDKMVQQYQECTLAVDEAVGRLTALLEQTGQLENTVVVYVADQGFAMGQHGLTAKSQPYHANIVAPCIVRYPARFPKGAVVNDPITGADFTTTFHRLAGIEPAWKMHGRDLTPLLSAPGASPLAQPLVLTSTQQDYGQAAVEKAAQDSREYVPKAGAGGNWLMLHDGQFKYIRRICKTGEEELFDTRTDPDELRNLAAKPAYRATLVRLRQQLNREMRERLDGAALMDAISSATPR